MIKNQEKVYLPIATQPTCSSGFSVSTPPVQSHMLDGQFAGQFNLHQEVMPEFPIQAPVATQEDDDDDVDEGGEE